MSAIRSRTRKKRLKINKRKKRQRLVPRSKRRSIRSNSKTRLKTSARSILVLDHFVPHFDQDTGSRTLYQYIKLFLDMGLQVYFAGYDPTRYEPYTSHLEKLGVKVFNNHTHLQNWLKKNKKRLAYAYINRPHVAERFLPLLRSKSKAKIIYNSVDLQFLRELRRAQLEGDQAAIAQAEQIKQRELQWFRMSDVVFTVSDYERDLLMQELPEKTVVTIPTFFYQPPFPIGMQAPSREERTDITFVGGFNHSPNIDGVLWFVREIIPLIQIHLPQVHFNIIGSNPTPSILALANDKIHVTGFIPDEALEQYYTRSRVVVAPLRYGAGVKGKIIEAVARGIPVVTTSIGIEGIRQSENIVTVCDTAEAFAIHTIDLYRNEERWQFIRKQQIDYSHHFLTINYAKQVIMPYINKNADRRPCHRRQSRRFS